VALLGQVAAWLLIGKGSPRVAPNASAALLLLQPLIALGLAFAVLRETPAPIQLCGGALVIGAVWIGNRIPQARIAGQPLIGAERSSSMVTGRCAASSLPAATLVEQPALEAATASRGKPRTPEEQPARMMTAPADAIATWQRR
jgi:hypothetical protein